MNVRTHYSTSAARRYAWSAIDDDTYDGAPDAGCASVVGLGPTEEAAINDLLEQFEDGEPWQQQAAQEYRRIAA